jgi:hypothetical protein
MMPQFDRNCLYFSAAGILVLLLVFPLEARGQCPGGPVQEFVPWQRQWTLSASQTWPAGFYDQVAYGAGAWTNAFSSRGQSWASMTHGGSDVTIMQADLAGYGLADTGNNILFVDPDLFNPSLNQDFVRALILHELGHFMGFAQATGSDSVMSDTSPSSFHSTFTVCDNQQMNSYYGDPVGGECNPVYNPAGCSPIIINFGQGTLTLTDPDVWFDLRGTGQRLLLSWPSPGSDQGFLVFDRDRNGLIESGLELFGDVTPLSWASSGPRAHHGFEALAFFDMPENGGNGDGWINANDLVHNHLQIWIDSNHDGVSQQGELQSLGNVGILAISVVASQDARRDPVGNVYRYRAPVLLVNENGATVHRFAYDVYLTSR